MLKKQQGLVEWLEFELLAAYPNISHGVFLRKGGTSMPPYHSLNLSPYVGDNPQHVIQNQEIVRNVIGATRLFLKQCHGTTLYEYIGDSLLEGGEGDGLMTRIPGIGLTIFHADCQAAIFYDPVRHVVANIHAGWRGMVQNIYARAIREMNERYQSKAQDLLVCISPSLEPTYAEFCNYTKEFPPQFHAFQTTSNHFDLWEVSKQQLIACGILEEHVEIARIGTYGSPEDFYSYRREAITGRNATVVAIL